MLAPPVALPLPWIPSMEGDADGGPGWYEDVDDSGEAYMIALPAELVADGVSKEDGTRPYGEWSMIASPQGMSHNKLLFMRGTR